MKKIARFLRIFLRARQVSRADGLFGLLKRPGRFSADFYYVSPVEKQAELALNCQARFLLEKKNALILKIIFKKLENAEICR